MIAVTLAALLLQAAASPPEDAPTDPYAFLAEQPAPAPARPTGTTPEAADHACRGQIHRRPGETRVACVARLIETDALSVPLPVGNTPSSETRRCRRVSTQSEDGTSSSFRVICSSGDAALAEEMLDSLLHED